MGSNVVLDLLTVIIWTQTFFKGWNITIRFILMSVLNAMSLKIIFLP